MKHCEKCGVNVNSNENYCPLCFNEITNNSDEKTNPMYSTCAIKPRSITKTHKTQKIFFLISLFVIAVCAFINYVTKTPAWSVLIALSIMYLWIMVMHTILSSRNTFEKVLLQLVGIVSILLCTNLISGGGTWFLEYVLPSILILALVVLNMILFITKRRKRFEVGFFIIELMLLIVSIVFVSTQFATFKILYWISLLLSTLSMLGIMLFDGKNLRTELTKKFHL